MPLLNVVEEIYNRNFSRKVIPYSRTREPLSLGNNLTKLKEQNKTGIIAEFKRKSPSGFSNKNSPELRTYFNSLKGNNRIAGFSILTEPDYFLGDYSDIVSAQNFNVPILDKDFISTKKMVDNAFNSGADAILLILDFLAPEDIYLLSDYASHLGLESLIEFHNLALVDRIEEGPYRIFGYNRRNLITLKMEPQEEQLNEIVSRKEFRFVLESGINSQYVKTHDISSYLGMLVGTSILEGDSV